MGIVKKIQIYQKKGWAPMDPPMYPQEFSDMSVIQFAI